MYKQGQGQPTSFSETNEAFVTTDDENEEENENVGRDADGLKAEEETYGASNEGTEARPGRIIACTDNK